jgi:hypothetical protein
MTELIDVNFGRVSYVYMQYKIKNSAYDISNTFSEILGTLLDVSPCTASFLGVESTKTQRSVEHIRLISHYYEESCIVVNV